MIHKFDKCSFIVQNKKKIKVFFYGEEGKNYWKYSLLREKAFNSIGSREYTKIFKEV